MEKKTLPAWIAILFSALLFLASVAWAESPKDSPSRSGKGKSGYIDVHNHLFGTTGGEMFGHGTDYPGAVSAALRAVGFTSR